MFTLTSYYVCSGEKEPVNRITTNDFFDIEQIMHQMATEIIDMIPLGKFYNLPLNIDNTISYIVGDRNNRYIFIGAPSSRYFCVMCHLTDNDDDPHDTIMLRGCAIDVNNDVSIRIGNNIIKYPLPRTFYDIFDKVEEMFNNWEQCPFIAGMSYYVPVYKFDNTGRVATYIDSICCSAFDDMEEQCKDILKMINSNAYDNICEKIELPIATTLSVYTSRRYESRIEGYIDDESGHLVKIVINPIFRIVNDNNCSMILIYDGHPIEKDDNKQYIPMYNYEKIIQYFDGIEEFNTRHSSLSRAYDAVNKNSLVLLQAITQKAESNTDIDDTTEV